jgi:hypothetical protein
MVGIEANTEVMTRGGRYLLEKQQQDGSWFVSSHSIHNDEVGEAYRKRIDTVYSYWGSAWATLALLHCIPTTR